MRSAKKQHQGINKEIQVAKFFIARYFSDLLEIICLIVFNWIVKKLTAQ